MILDQIIKQKKEQIKTQKQKLPKEELIQIIKEKKLPPTKDFYSALKKENEIAIIAEVKKASPSRGIICRDFEPVNIAYNYYKKNVDAISVLTETEFFMGNDDYLLKIRENVPAPLLRKDFIIDCWQVCQSRLLGADAILLIVSVLNDEQLRNFQITSEILGMDCLVECHDEYEIERAVLSGAKIIGINNRDLRTFETSLDTTVRLAKYVPDDILTVSESGIRNREDINYMYEAGADAVLIGEAFMLNEI